MLNIKLYFVYRTTHLPSGKMFFGIHASDDLNFGSAEYKDQFIGSGWKIKDLIDGGAKRHHFRVEMLYNSGSLTEAMTFFKRIRMDYDHPLCLNVKEGAPAGVPKSEEHRAAIAAAVAPSMVGNGNAVGQPGQAAAVIKEQLESQGVTPPKLKWYNDGTQSKLIPVNDDNTPINANYTSWTMGQLRKVKAKA